MNRKYIIPLFAILGIALVSAGLVTYFDRVQTDVDVIAPITLEDNLFDISGETLNDGNNHYLLVKGENTFSQEILTDIVITIRKDGGIVTDITGIHIAIDTGGDMHYCYDGTSVREEYCDNNYIQYLTNNPDVFSWAGTDENLVLSGFVSPINDVNGWFDGSGFVIDGILSFPIGVDSGIIASLIAIRADHGLEPGAYTIEVEFKPRA